VFDPLRFFDEVIDSLGEEVHKGRLTLYTYDLSSTSPLALHAHSTSCIDCSFERFHSRPRCDLSYQNHYPLNFALSTRLAGSTNKRLYTAYQIIGILRRVAEAAYQVIIIRRSQCTVKMFLSDLEGIGANPYSVMRYSKGLDRPGAILAVPHYTIGLSQPTEALTNYLVSKVVTDY
jgi:hypothetical protein